MSVWPPNGDGPDGFPNGLWVAVLPNGDSPDGFAAAKLPKPLPPAFANEPNPPPELALNPIEPRLFPGVEGCPKLDIPKVGLLCPRALG